MAPTHAAGKPNAHQHEAQARLRRRSVWIVHEDLAYASRRGANGSGEFRRGLVLQGAVGEFRPASAHNVWDCRVSGAGRLHSCAGGDAHFETLYEGGHEDAPAAAPVDSGCSLVESGQEARHSREDHRGALPVAAGGEHSGHMWLDEPQAEDAVEDLHAAGVRGGAAEEGMAARVPGAGGSGAAGRADTHGALRGFGQFGLAESGRGGGRSLRAAREAGMQALRLGGEHVATCGGVGSAEVEVGDSGDRRRAGPGDAAGGGHVMVAEGDGEMVARDGGGRAIGLDADGSEGGAAAGCGEGVVGEGRVDAGLAAAPAPAHGMAQGAVDHEGGEGCVDGWGRSEEGLDGEGDREDSEDSREGSWSGRHSAGAEEGL